MRSCFFLIASKIEWDLTNGPLSCDRAIRYSGFFEVREKWVRPLEISWIDWKSCNQWSLVHICNDGPAQLSSSAWLHPTPAHGLQSRSMLVWKWTFERCAFFIYWKAFEVWRVFLYMLKFIVLCAFPCAIRRFEWISSLVGLWDVILVLQSCGDIQLAKNTCNYIECIYIYT